MNNVSKYLNGIVLAILGMLLIISAWAHFSDNYDLTINFYVGTVCYITTILLNIFKHKSAKFSIILLLTLSAFNIISFTFDNIAIGSSKIYSSDWFYYILPSPNPVFLLALVVYTIIDTINSRAFYGSNVEIQEKYQKEAKFYYEKFRNGTEEEFGYAVKNIKDYPKAAQDAISVIISQKEDIKKE